MMLRCRADGRVVLAGAHEDVVVFRHATGQCELRRTEGVWIGIAPDITAETKDLVLELGAGDLLVLYTDGLIEARSDTGEEFGIERVMDIVRHNSAATVESIQAKLVDAVRSWTPVQQDDVTVLVLRRPQHLTPAATTFS